MLAIISKKDFIDSNVIKDYCLNLPKSIFKQSNFDKKRIQKDGWGIAYYSEGKPIIFKSPNPIFEEKELFESKIKEAINTKIFIAHIRDASNPKNLPHKKLIAIENTQPFSNNEIVFTHNGTLFICDEVYSKLGKYKKYVKGVNDSEVLFWEFIKVLDAYGDISTALEMTRDEINTIWFSIEKEMKQKGIKSPYRGLNIFVTNGKEFYALCDYKLNPEKYSIMTPGWEWGKYAIKEDKENIIISSEPLDDSNWTKSDFPAIITIEKNNKVKMRPII